MINYNECCCMVTWHKAFSSKISSESTPSKTSVSLLKTSSSPPEPDDSKPPPPPFSIQSSSASRISFLYSSCSSSIFSIKRVTKTSKWRFWRARCVYRESGRLAKFSSLKISTKQASQLVKAKDRLGSALLSSSIPSLLNKFFCASNSFKNLTNGTEEPIELYLIFLKNIFS